MHSNSAINRIFIWTTLTVITVTAISYLRMHALIKASELVNHTNLVKENLEKLGWNISSVESNQRGYLLTGDSSFLSLRAASLSDLNQNFVLLDSLIADNPMQVASSENLHKRINARIGALDSILRINKPLIDPGLQKQTLEGKRLMTGIKKEIGGMTLVENILLETRTHTLRRQLVVAPATILFLSLLSLLALFWSFRRLARALTKAEALQKGQHQMTELISHKNTELEKRNLAVERQNQDLEKMNEELESFSYIAGHDLQEPLRKIQIFLGRIADSKTLQPEALQDFERIERAAKRMQMLINDLLSYSRTSRGEKYFEHTDLNDIINQIRDELSDKLVAKNTTLNVQNLPITSAIPYQIKQLFTNLIENSLKFSRPNVDPVINISCTTIDGATNEYDLPLTKSKYYQITVSDNGIGFEEEYNEKIFGVFQRLHGRKEYEGTGIGLSIVRKIAENHQGTIIARAKPDKGAKFILFLPALN
jgi:signal transduction histidine kinase